MTTTTLDGSAVPYLISADTTLQANDGDELLALGTIDILGEIFLNGPGGPFTSQPSSVAQFSLLLLASPTVTLTGGGTVLLGGTDPANISGDSATLQTLVNAGDTITGTGGIGGSTFAIDSGDTLYPLALINAAGGVIDANGTVAATGSTQATFVPAQALYVSGGGSVLVNSGVMEATGIGGLFISATTIDQSGGGTILATGSGVAVSVAPIGFGSSVDLIGGTLDATNGGSISFRRSANLVLDGSGSPLVIGNGSDIEISLLDASVHVLGSIVDLGTLGGGAPLILYSPTVTMSGGGNLLNPLIFGQGGSLAGLVNATTLSGGGHIGVSDFSYFSPVVDNGAQVVGSAPIALTNLAGGVIDATGNTISGLTDIGRGGSGILLYNGGTTSINNGTIEATGIEGVNIDGGTLDQTGGGTLLASGAGTGIYLQSVDVIGGQLISNNGGSIAFNVGAGTLTSNGAPIAINAGGVLEVTSSGVTGASPGTLTIHGSVIANAGTIVDKSTLLLGSPTVTLGGGGSWQLAGVLNTAGTGTLINNDNTLTGSGDISGAGVSVTNAARGVINGSSLDIATVANFGLLENVSVGVTNATTIVNTGAGELLASGAGALVTLYNADIAGGTLAASGGGAFQLIALSQIQQAVTLDGRAAPVTIAAGTTVRDLANTNSDSGLVLLGTIDLLGTILGDLNIHSGPFAIPNAGVLTGTGTVSGYLINTGTVLAQSGTLTVTNDVDGGGGIVIGSGGAFVLGGESGETVNFGGGANERIVLNTPAAFTGTLENLAIGDRIDMGTNDIQSAIATGDTLHVTMTDASTLTYTLSGLAAGATFSPVITQGAVASELLVQCFAQGTRIATPDGEREVEDLDVGDTVLLVSGNAEDIVWIGYRRIDARRHSDPARLWPVRITAGAFGPGRPCRDLFLSPDHAVFVDGVLIPIRHLINGTTIARSPVDEIVYYHIELASHNLLLAEGMPTESWLGTGDRSRFDNSVHAAVPHRGVSGHMWEAMGCAPLIVTGSRLHTARQFVDRWAFEIGRTAARPSTHDREMAWPE